MLSKIIAYSLIILSSCNDKNDIISGGYNDAPEIVTRFIIISEDETVTITEQMLNASDVDDTDENITLTVSAVIHGEFQLNSVLTTSFTVADIAAGVVTFVHDGGEDAPTADIIAADRPWARPWKKL